jgi:hypothetical protein
MSPPTQCALWTDPEATLAKPLKQQFTLHATFVEESHWWRCLLECRDCGQRSVYEFHEEADRADGDDPQYVTFVPVETQAEIDAACAAPQGSSPVRAAALRKDWPKGAALHQLRWVT